jgi:hypothetical protein
MCLAGQLESCDYCMDLKEQVIGELNFRTTPALPPPTQREAENSALTPNDDDLWGSVDDIDLTLINDIDQTRPVIPRFPKDRTEGVSTNRIDQRGKLICILVPACLNIYLKVEVKVEV